MSVAVRPLIAFVLCSALVAGLVDAQAVPPEYERLAGAVTDGDLIVGEIPEGFPAEILPDDAEVLGSVTGRGMISVMLTVPRDPRPVEREIRNALVQNGWVNVEPHGAGGFVQSPPRDLPDSLAMFTRMPFYCRGVEGLYVAANRDAAGSEVKIDWGPDRPLWCDDSLTARSIMPALHAPDGVQLIGGGVSSGDHFASARSSAGAELTPRELGQHFANQLEDAGWSVEMGESIAAFAALSAERIDEEGQRWFGFLSIVRIPEIGRHSLEFQIMRPEELLEESREFR